MLCDKYQVHSNKIAINNNSQLAALVRMFRAEARKLLEPPVLVSNRDLVTRFLECLDPSFSSKVEDKLDNLIDTRDIYEKKNPTESTGGTTAGMTAATVPAVTK